MAQGSIPDLELSENLVHLWLADLRDWRPEIDSFLGLLSEDEVLRLERYKVNEKQDQFLLSRGLLRQLLAGYLQQKPARIQFTTNQAGKPFLVGRPFQFNLSHTGNLACFAITLKDPIGVDIQEVYPISSRDTLIKKYFSEKEQKYLDSLSPASRQEGFFLIWTAKEAYLKAMGKGFTTSPRGISLLPNSDKGLNLTWPGMPAAGEFPTWFIKNLTLPEGYQGALAVCGPPKTIHELPLTPDSLGS